MAYNDMAVMSHDDVINKDLEDIIIKVPFHLPLYIYDSFLSYVEPTPEFAKELFEVVKKNRKRLAPYRTLAAKGKTADDFYAEMEKIRDNWATGTAFEYFLIEGTNNIIGSAGLTRIDWTHRSSELTCWLAKEATQKDLGLESIKALEQVAFETLDLNRLVIRFDTDNASCKRAVEREATALGYVCEGISRQEMFSPGRNKFIDMVRYSKLRSDSQR